MENLWQDSEGVLEDDNFFQRDLIDEEDSNAPEFYINEDGSNEPFASSIGY